MTYGSHNDTVLTAKPQVTEGAVVAGHKPGSVVEQNEVGRVLVRQLEADLFESSTWLGRLIYPTFVRKTSVYLDDADARRLAILAEREGVPQAALLRRAIRAYVPQPRESRNFALNGAGEGPGGSVADVEATVLLAGFGG